MIERRECAPPKPADARVQFTAPTVAAAGSRLSLDFIGVVAVAAIACVGFSHPLALWPAPYETLTTIVFVAVIVIFNSFGAFQRYGEFASYVGLDGPALFALLLLVDFRLYAIGVLASEFSIFVSETTRGVNPTKWYFRLFNASTYVLAGAAASFVFHACCGDAGSAPNAMRWTSPTAFVALLMAAVLWKSCDVLLTHVCLALASDAPLLQLRTSPRQLAGEFAVLFMAIPLAALWSFNGWLALFALASIAGGSVLLHVSETEYRLRIDERTGLTNAAAFDEKFAAALSEATRQKRGFALLVIDIDHFKAVNDSFGHDLGDRVIVWFAELLASQARVDDVLARVGGEEFALLVRDADRTEALQIGERLRLSIAENAYEAPGTIALPVTASVGIAVFPDDGDETRELFRSADGALYSAKRSGRNAVRASQGRLRRD